MFLILTILILVLYKDVYLLIPCLVFAAFFYVNGIYVWHTVTENRYIILEGLCSSVDKTPLRKRVKNIYLETEAGTVKIVIRQCIKQMEKGDNIRVYISKHTSQEISLEDLDFEPAVDFEEQYSQTNSEQKSFEFEEEHLANAFAALPLLRQKVLEMLFVQELTPLEISKRMHCSVKYVYDQKYLALQKLRRLLGGEPHGK